MNPDQTASTRAEQTMSWVRIACKNRATHQMLNETGEKRVTYNALSELRCSDKGYYKILYNIMLNKRINIANQTKNLFFSSDQYIFQYSK